MKQNNLLKSSMMVLLMFFAITSVWGQTTVTYSFNGGSTSGDLDANISFTTHRNGGTADPVVNSGKLRLYQNATKGGSIKVNAKNGVEITRVVMNVDTTGDGKGPRGYSVDNTTEAGTFAQGTNPNVMNVSANSYVEYYSKGSSSSTRTYVSSFSVTYVDSVAPCDTPSGTINEDIQEVNVPNSATFTIDNAADYTSIQWERSIDGGTSWSDISGATGLTYTTGATTTAMDGYMFRAELTNAASGCTATTFTTNEAMLFVTEIVTAPVLEDATLNGTVGTSFNYNIVNTGGTATYTIVDGELPTGLTLTGGTISGTPTVTGDFIVEIEGTNETGSASAIIDFTIAQGTQTVTGLTNLSKNINDAPFDLPLTTNAGLTLSYESSNTSVATVSGNTITLEGLGSTIITATQAGDENWNSFTQDITLTVVDGPCGTETFTNLGARVSSYGTRTWTGDGNIEWSATNARTDYTLTGPLPTGGESSPERAILMNGSSVLTNTVEISGGVGALTFQYARAFTSGVPVIKVYVNDVQYGGDIVVPTGNPNPIATFEQVINAEGPATIRIEITPLSSGNRVVIDNLSWTCFEAPSETITWTTGNVWSNGTGPVSTSEDVVIEGTLVTSGDLLGKNLTVVNGGSLTIASGNTVTLAGKITNEAGAANFVVSSGANLIQDATYTTNDNEGAITVERESQDIVRLDYTMWSSPVTGQQLQAFSPATLPNRIYTYETTLATESTDGGYVAAVATSDFANGKGYLFRTPNTWGTTPAPYAGAFLGVPFNGAVTVPVYNNGFTSVGNPYASNIDPELFMVENDVESLYFWNNPSRVDNGDGTYSYVGTKYVAFTGAGFDDPSYDGNSITVGQGFLVESSSASSVTFNNEMRTSAAGTFFKTTTTERHRIWLNLSNESSQTHNHVLVSYMSGATNGLDSKIDGQQFGYEGSALYSLIDAEKFSIQGRALPFAASDVVALGFKAVESGKFNISLAQFDGLFAEGEVTVYLKDKQTKTLHNLSESAYGFESAAGEFNDRFEIVYETEEIMGSDDLTSNSVQIYTSNNQIVVSSKSEKILSVELFDLQGRNMHSNHKVNADTYQIKSASKGVLVVKVQTQNGEVVTKKVINK